MPHPEEAKDVCRISEASLVTLVRSREYAATEFTQRAAQLDRIYDV